VSPPDGGRNEIVYDIIRPLYGVPSSPCALHVTLDSCFKSLGFLNVGFESAVWHRPADHRYSDAQLTTDTRGISG